VTESVALFRHLPELADRVAWARLGDWPTPIDSVIVDGRPIWIKRECDSSARYGGNKIRTLEAWLGHARALGKRRIWAIGATGSNHAIATILHARAIGLDAAAIVFPQPGSSWADENFAAIRASGCELVKLRHVIEVPFAALAIARRDRGGIVMPPGGATPLGAFGAVSAALELADQIAADLAPPPRRIVLPIGSTCTTAGLLAGFALAKSLGAWPWTLPIIHAVRVTPWPVTSRLRTAVLAARTLARVGRPAPFAQLLRHLFVDGRELGGGYGRTTPRSIAAAHVLAHARIRIDSVYSAKAAAALLRVHGEHVGPLMFWATKTATSSR
jgi:D-cysteine desulfhydrase